MPKAARLLLATFFWMFSAITPNAFAAAVDGAPTFKAGQDPGVYVWREANGNWQMRLTSGGKYQNAAGGFSSTQPLPWIAGAATERDDVVEKRNPNVADFNLKTSTSDYIDGVSFAASKGAGVCFWSWSPLMGNLVYLGAKAIPTTTPVDLLNNGGCSGNAIPSYSVKLKYHPGHYIVTNYWEGVLGQQSAIIEAASKPGVTGVLVRYRWIDLEPSFGNYDFSKVAADLTIAADHGMQFIAWIEDKSFMPDVKPTPPYLWKNYTVAHNSWTGGYVAKRWLPYVTERMNALTKVMGARFDSHPNFEGVIFGESALSFSAAQEKSYGYSPEAYRDETIKMLKNTRANFPHSQVFWAMNFFPQKQSYIGDIANAVAPYKIAMGGPDILPDDDSLTRLTYPYYTQFKGKMVLFGSAENNSFNHLRLDKTTKYWTMPEIFWFARDKLHVDYVLWNQKRTADPSDSYTWINALPVIKNNPTFNQ